MFVLLTDRQTDQTHTGYSHHDYQCHLLSAVTDSICFTHTHKHTWTHTNGHRHTDRSACTCTPTITHPTSATLDTCYVVLAVCAPSCLSKNNHRSAHTWNMNYGKERERGEKERGRERAGSQEVRAIYKQRSSRRERDREKRERERDSSIGVKLRPNSSLACSHRVQIAYCGATANMPTSFHFIHYHCSNSTLRP